jgi:hypothetical protein
VQNSIRKFLGLSGRGGKGQARGCGRRRLGTTMSLCTTFCFALYVSLFPPRLRARMLPSELQRLQPLPPLQQQLLKLLRVLLVPPLSRWQRPRQRLRPLPAQGLGVGSDFCRIHAAFMLPLRTCRCRSWCLACPFPSCLYHQCSVGRIGGIWYICWASHVL